MGQLVYIQIFDDEVTFKFERETKVENIMLLENNVMIDHEHIRGSTSPTLILISLEVFGIHQK